MSCLIDCLDSGGASQTRSRQKIRNIPKNVLSGLETAPVRIRISYLPAHDYTTHSKLGPGTRETGITAAAVYGSRYRESTEHSWRRRLTRSVLCVSAPTTNNP